MFGDEFGSVPYATAVRLFSSLSWLVGIFHQFVVLREFCLLYFSLCSLDARLDFAKLLLTRNTSSASRSIVRQLRTLGPFCHRAIIYSIALKSRELTGRGWGTETPAT